MRTWVRGGPPGRTREGAIVAQMSAAWRAEDLKRSVALVLFDASNAFACTSEARLHRIAEDWFKQDAAYVKDVSTYANIQAPAVDTTYSCHPRHGGLMGHALAPLMCVQD